ncbi:MAG TPA: MFS transporter [Terracidiphilus sp.]|nr:MFS transporter [Terracidiphilus sp.]
MKPMPISRRTMLLVLYPAFALTGIGDAITGPLLPALARTFHLSDNQSGLLVFCAFAGMASGAFLCRGNYAHTLTRGLFGMMIACALFPWLARSSLYPGAFLFGISVGVPMTAVSLFTGRNYTERLAATLTMLNFSWSAGALLAPLLAARLLAAASWRAVYFALAGAAGLAALAVGLVIRDSAETARVTAETTGLRNVRLLAVFATFFFFEVGIESTFAAWISTYVMRSTGVAMTVAAAATAVFWTGFLASRGVAPLVLLRMRHGSLLRMALVTALAAATLMLATRWSLLMGAAILLLGAALGPVFPVALAAFFDRARHTSDSRFILAFSGFGGSVLPWLVGFVSGRSGSLRAGLLVAPAVLLTMTLMLPWLRVTQSARPAVVAE